MHKISCDSQHRCVRYLHWTILLPLIIYLSLLFVKYNKNVPLKSLTSPSKEKDNEGAMIENLFVELEAVTANKRDLERYRNVGLDRRDEQSIREAEEAENNENPRTVLEDIFQRADTDQNQVLDIQELAKWIHTKITEHISRAMRENVGLFTAIDNNPRNGNCH